MKEDIMGHPCPECGGTNFYCADCADPEIEALRAVEDAARAVRDGPALAVEQVGVKSIIVGSRNWKVLVNALDALKKARGGD